uniref:Uncharacterized protein n=1 Tax=Lactuca sativa TaxID=4236 RepID=A0A9R1UNM7_LACSA|nr:hypothetical protein LSAT_V11C800420800 [Lactuca sativa]
MSLLTLTPATSPPSPSSQLGDCSTVINAGFQATHPWIIRISISFLQPIWDAIVNVKPQLFIWLGDNIYGDIRRPFKLFGNERTIGPRKNVPRFLPSSVDEMQEKYKIAKNIHGYSCLREIAKVVSNLPACTGPLFYMESWGRFPSDGKHLSNMILDSMRDGVVFDCGTTYPLYDITSSGLTQAVEKVIPLFLHFGLRFLAWVTLTPTTMRVINNNCKYKSCTYGLSPL